MSSSTNNLTVPGRVNSIHRSASAVFEHESASVLEQKEKTSTGRKASITKSRSMTEILQLANAEEDLSTALARMTALPSPPSLSEAQEATRTRTEEAKKIRRDSIKLIRSRTASRAAALGRPILEIPQVEISGETAEADRDEKSMGKKEGGGEEDSTK